MKKIAAVVLICAVVLCLSGCQSSDYKAAVSAMDSGNYAEALTTLESLGDYKDAGELAQECRYALAAMDFDAGDYENAQAAFLALGDYKDSVDQAKACAYHLAVEVFEAGRYEEALKSFKGLDGYEDSADYVIRAENAILSEKLVGQWGSEDVDITSQVLAGWDYQSPELAEAAREEEFQISLSLILNLDNTGGFRLNLAISDMEGMMESLVGVFRKYLVKALDAALQEEGMSIQDLYTELGTEDIDEICVQLYGVNTQELLNNSGIQEGLETTFSMLNLQGDYEIKDGKVLLSDEEVEYDPDSDTLTLLADESFRNMTGKDSVEFHRQ